MGRSKQAWHWFLEVLRSDIFDTQGGTTPEGIHVGVMGGSLDIVMRAFAGIDIEKGRITINPDLPTHWRNLKCKFCYQRKWFTLSITKRLLTISIRGPGIKRGALAVEVQKKLHRLVLGKKYKIHL